MIDEAAVTRDFEAEFDEENTWQPVRLDGIKVLLVEDVLDARVLIGRILKRAGAEVFSASSAEEARHILAQRTPDIVVSDIAMPEEDGLDFMRRMRLEERAQGRSLPALALTALTDHQSHRQILKAGFHEHIGKAHGAGALLNAVYRLVYAGPPTLQ